MVKKILLAIALAVPMMISAQTLKIGLVDSNAIMQAHPDTKAAMTKMEEASKKYDEEGQKLQAEFQRMYEEFQKTADTELPAIKERKMRELQEYQNKMQTFAQSADQDLQRMQNDLLQPIQKKVKDAMDAVGKEGGYSLIQESASAYYYAAPVEDITAKVKAKLGI